MRRLRRWLRFELSCILAPWVDIRGGYGDYGFDRELRDR